MPRSLLTAARRLFECSIIICIICGIRSALSGEDSSVLASSPDRIREHRTGPVAVRVVDAEGRAVAGAEVAIRQKRHEFLFGCNIFLHGKLETPADEESYRGRFAALFNYATLPFYWRGYERERGKPDHGYRESVARWCRENGIVAKGHPLVWNHPASVPDWLPEDPLAVRELSEGRVKDCAGRFRGLIDIWDVVNEATDPLRFDERNLMTRAYRSLGVEEWTRRSFLAAREAAPGATLLINDYRTDERYRELIAGLVRDGKPLYDAIGIQSHMHGGAWSPERTWEVCEAFARFGAPLHFTETTILSGRRRAGGKEWGPSEPELEEVQAREVERFYTVLFSHPAVEAITWWDLADRGAWQGAPAGFLRRDLSPKPAYERLLDLVRKRWWTEERLVTDENGEAAARAFYGDYLVTARKGGLEAALNLKHARRGGGSRLELRLGSP